MSGKDLFEGMSYVDERFIDEAESKTLPKRMASPWLKTASIAACLCLIILCLYDLNSHQNIVPTEGAAGDVVGDAMAEGGVEPADRPAASTVDMVEEALPEGIVGSEGPHAERAPEMILRIKEVTDSGFIGTVTEPGSLIVFEAGTEVTVIWDVETDPDHSSDDYRAGDLVHLVLTSWDEEEKTIVASVLGIVEEPIYD